MTMAQAGFVKQLVLVLPQAICTTLTLGPGNTPRFGAPFSSICLSALPFDDKTLEEDSASSSRSLLGDPSPNSDSETCDPVPEMPLAQMTVDSRSLVGFEDLGDVI
jgi:hypothetical protein